MYREANILIPVAGFIPKVIGNKRAIAIVADNPGMAPTNNPKAVPIMTDKRLEIDITFFKPSNKFSNIIFYPPYCNNPIGIGNFKNTTNKKYTNAVNPIDIKTIFLTFVAFRKI